MKFFKHLRFRKYRDWFMFDEVNPEAGQIAPALAHTGHENWLTIYQAFCEVNSQSQSTLRGLSYGN